MKSSNHYRKIVLSNIKHDIINHVNAILGYSELIIDILDNDEQQGLGSDMHSIHTSAVDILSNINEIFKNDSGNGDDNIGDIIHKVYYIQFFNILYLFILYYFYKQNIKYEFNNQTELF